MRHILAFGLATSLIATTVLLSVSRAADEKPKYTLSQVMKAHKKVRDKILDGSASQADKDKLVEMYKAMAQADPPKGDKEHWKKLTNECVVAAEEVAAGKEGGIEHLKKASDCRGCHTVHKGS